eukprot:PhF_6_TR26673/c2_g1_i1/m.38767
MEKNVKITDELSQLAPRFIEEAHEATTTLELFAQISEATHVNINHGDHIVNELLLALTNVRRMKADLKQTIKTEREAKLQHLEHTIQNQRMEVRKLMEEHTNMDAQLTNAQAEIRLLDRHIAVYKPTTIIPNGFSAQEPVARRARSRVRILAEETDEGGELDDESLTHHVAGALAMSEEFFASWFDPSRSLSPPSTTAESTPTPVKLPSVLSPAQMKGKKLGEFLKSPVRNRNSKSTRVT